MEEYTDYQKLIALGFLPGLRDTDPSKYQYEALDNLAKEHTILTAPSTIEVSSDKVSTGNLITNFSYKEVVNKYKVSPLLIKFPDLNYAYPINMGGYLASSTHSIYTESFRRSFRLRDTTLGFVASDITDTYYLETFIFQAGNATANEDGSTSYKITTDIDTIKDCIAAAKARKGNQRIVVNTPDGRFCEFSIVYPRTDSLRALTAFGDTGYALSLSSVEYESTLIVKDGIIDLSDYYTKEETNIKLSGYALKDSVLPMIELDSNFATWITGIATVLSEHKFENPIADVRVPNINLVKDHVTSNVNTEENIILFQKLSEKAYRISGASLRSAGATSAEITYTMDEKTATLQVNWAVDKQSDWNTSDSNDASFIKNKPTKLSQFTDDKGFATKTEVSEAVKNLSQSAVQKYDCSWVFKMSLNQAVGDSQWKELQTAIYADKCLFAYFKEKSVQVIAVDDSKSDNYTATTLYAFLTYGRLVIVTIDDNNDDDDVKITQYLTVSLRTDVISKDLDNKLDRPIIVDISANSVEVNCTELSGKLYSGSGVTALAISAAKTSGTKSGAADVFQFSTGASPAITVTGVSWANSDAPTFEAGKTYEIHIIYNATLDKFLATYAVYE